MTFHVSGAKQVLNLEDWLPGTVGSGVEFRSEGQDVIIEFFISEDRGITRRKRELRFLRVYSFRKELYEGPSIPIDVSFGDPDTSVMPDSLIEFEHSDIADGWTAGSRGRPRIRHYVIDLTFEEVTIGIFATSYQLGEEIKA
jgi:hypothetical protein